jgi:hypothetical protein
MVSRFVAKDFSHLEDNFKCGICMDLYIEPVSFNNCGHSFCKNCVVASKTLKCPMCSTKNTSYSRTRVIDSLMDQIAHKSVCQYQLLDCPNIRAGCKQKIKNMNIPAHIENCIYATRECPLCEETMLKKDQVNHEYECPKIEINCKFCQTEIKREDEVIHQSISCIMAPIQCKYTIIGCNGYVKRCDMDDHMKDKYDFHMNLLITMFDTLDITKLKKENMFKKEKCAKKDIRHEISDTRYPIRRRRYEIIQRRPEINSLDESTEMVMRKTNNV